MRLPLFPLHTVLFPGMPLPLRVCEPRYVELMDYCYRKNTTFGIALIRSGDEADPCVELHLIGTSAAIAHLEKMPDGQMHIEVVGQERFRIVRLHRAVAPYLIGSVIDYPLAACHAVLARQAARALVPWLSKYLTLLYQTAGTPFDEKHLPRDPAAIAYLAAIVVQIPNAEKQALLAFDTAAELLNRERAIYRREVSLVRAMLAGEQIHSGDYLSSN